jgi:hypothetical protein
VPVLALTLDGVHARTDVLPSPEGLQGDDAGALREFLGDLLGSGRCLEGAVLDLLTRPQADF